MTLADRHARELDRAIRSTLRRLGALRPAAKALGIPRSTLYDRARELGVKLGPPGRRRARRKAGR